MSPLLESATFPFRGNALVVNLTFGLIFGVALGSVGFAGPLALFILPAPVILGPSFLQYSLLTVCYAAYGRAGAPEPTLDEIGPFQAQPLMLAVALLGLGVPLDRSIGPNASVAGIALLAPAAVGAVVVEERALGAVSPKVLVPYIVGLGWTYPILVVLWTLAGRLIQFAMNSGLGAVPSVLLVQSLVLATCYATGRIIVGNADAIGYERPEAPEEQQVRRFGRDPPLHTRRP